MPGKSCFELSLVDGSVTSALLPESIRSAPGAVLGEYEHLRYTCSPGSWTTGRLGDDEPPRKPRERQRLGGPVGHPSVSAQVIQNLSGGRVRCRKDHTHDAGHAFAEGFDERPL